MRCDSVVLLAADHRNGPGQRRQWIHHRRTGGCRPLQDMGATLVTRGFRPVQNPYSDPHYKSNADKFLSPGGFPKSADRDGGRRCYSPGSEVVCGSILV